MTDIIDRAKGAMEGITPGEWEWDDHFDNLSPLWSCEMAQGYGYLSWNDGIEANARFIAAAPGLVRELIAEVERLRGALSLNLQFSDLVSRACDVDPDETTLRVVVQPSAREVVTISWAQALEKARTALEGGAP